MKSKTEINPECGLRLKEVLNQKKISQLELSKLSSFTPQYISYIIQGLRPMTVSAANAFAKALNIRQEYLLCEDNYKNKLSFERNQEIQSSINSADLELDYEFQDSLGNIVNILKQKCTLGGLVCSEQDLKEFYVDIENYINMRFEKWLLPHSQKCILKIDDLTMSDGYLHLDRTNRIMKLFEELIQNNPVAADIIYNVVKDTATGKRTTPETTPAERAKHWPEIIKRLEKYNITIEFPKDFSLKNIPESFYYTCLGIVDGIDMSQALSSTSIK